MSQTHATQTEISPITATGFITPIALADISADVIYTKTTVNNLSSSWIGGNSAFTYVNANSANFVKLSSEAYTFIPSTSSITTIVGSNITSGTFSTIAGGERNCANSNDTNIGGGCCNAALGSFSSVVGGKCDFSNNITTRNICKSFTI